MKKIIYFFIVAFMLISCDNKPTQEEISINNVIKLKEEIYNDIVDGISKNLKDPTSLKFGDNMLFIQKISNPIDIKNNKNIEFLYETGYDYYIIKFLDYYAKNSFGAYNGKNTTTLLFKCKIENTDENGINNYYVNSFDLSIHPYYIDIIKYFSKIEYEEKPFYKEELTLENQHYFMELSGMIKVPENMVM